MRLCRRSLPAASRAGRSARTSTRSLAQVPNDDTQLRLLDAVKEHDRAICAAQAAGAVAVDEIMQWTRATAETGRPTVHRSGEYVK